MWLQMAGFPFLWLNNISPWSTHACACVHVYFLSSAIDGHLICFHILAIVNNAAIKKNMQISLQDSDFVPFGCNPRSGIVVSHGGSIFNVLSSLCIVFHST